MLLAIKINYHKSFFSRITIHQTVGETGLGDIKFCKFENYFYAHRMGVLFYCQKANIMQEAFVPKTLK